MIFYKSVSAGNDFIHIEMDELDQPGDIKVDRVVKGELAKNLCQRNLGVGADGVIYYKIRNKEGVDFEIFNRDGSEAELSGNGMAGLSALLFYLGRFNERLVLCTRSGQRTQRILSRVENTFKLKIEIGDADFQNKDFFPFLQENKICYQYEWGQENITFYPVSVGNPHAVVLLEKELTEEKMMAVGRLLGEADIFPQKTNVELVLPMAAEAKGCCIFYYERGVGRTMASATGSAAVFAVLRELKWVKNSLVVHTPFEEIKISGKRKIYVENFTKIVYKGTYLNWPK